MGKLTSSILSLATLALLLVPLASAAEVAGKVGYMSGSLIAKRADGTVKIMGSKSEVMAGDELETAKDSYAQVVMNDGSQMTIRPNSNLKIEAFQFKTEEPKEDNAIFRLLRGGFRTVSGLIGKRGNPDAYKLRATTATIGIRGTDFTTRLCTNQDCEDEPNAAPPVAPPTVGRVMLIQGGLTAKDATGKTRKLVVGSAVYEGEILSTAKNSHAVVAFRDEGRVTLQEETDFHVETFKYNHQQAGLPAQTSQENAVFRLLKGGVRVVSGLIGHIKHDNYQFKMTTATIGIRGTGFDAWCNGECATGGDKPGTTEATPLKGAGVYVWSGQVALSMANATQLVSVGQAAIIGRDLKPVVVIKIPDSITQNKTPRPDGVKVDMQKEFENESKPAPTTPPEKSGGKAEPGVYVTVHDGQIILTQANGDTLGVGKGQTGFANDKTLIKLLLTPGFMSKDKPLDLNEMGTGASNKTATGPTQAGCLVK